MALDKLDQLAREINEAFAAEESARVRAGQLLLEAKRIHGDDGFRQWCEQHVKPQRSWRDCRKVMGLAAANDPVKAQQTERWKAKEGMQRTRKRRPAAVARSNVRPDSASSSRGALVTEMVHQDTVIELRVREITGSGGRWRVESSYPDGNRSWRPVWVDVDGNSDSYDGSDPTKEAAIEAANQHLVDFYDAHPDDDIPPDILAKLRAAGRTLDDSDDAEPEQQRDPVAPEPRSDASVKPMNRGSQDAVAADRSGDQTITTTVEDAAAPEVEHALEPEKVEKPATEPERDGTYEVPEKGKGRIETLDDPHPGIPNLRLRIDALEKLVITKQERVDKLEAEGRAKDARIAELEALCREKDKKIADQRSLISDLESAIPFSDEHVAS